MDVSCERCKTEYEFDDALISARGTSVRCTSCGFEFVLFPPSSQQIPETWRVFPQRAGRPSELCYESITELQFAILRGEVALEDLLARGDEAARPLASIVELAPLFEQLKSTAEVQEAAEFDAEESAPFEEAPPPISPRIFSPLSAKMEQSSAAQWETPEVEPVSPLRARLPSLSSSLAGFHWSETAQSEPSLLQPEVSEQQEVEERARRDEPDVQPVLVQEPFAGAPPLSPGVAPSLPASLYARSEDGEKESAPWSQPSSFASSSRRGAHSGLLVLAVLVGAMAFLGIALQDRWKTWLGWEPASELAQEEAGKQDRAPAPAQEELNLVPAEVAWWKLRLVEEGTPEWEQAEQELSEQIARLGSRWESADSGKAQQGVEELSQKIDWLRMQGHIAKARLLVPQARAQLPAYSLALLDLAENSQNPAWPSIVRRLEEAKIGERGDYLATSALIYALTRSGQRAEAERLLERLPQLKGGQDAPLLPALRDFVKRSQTAHSDVLVTGEEPPESSGGPGAAPAGAPAKGQVEWTPPPRRSSPQVSAEVQAWVAAADAHWNGGRKEEAAALYRKVLDQVGSQHFLAQRAQARILQAERERAE